MATSMSPTAITFNDGTTQSSAGATGNVVMNVYGGSSTWTKPATVKSIRVTVVGGGGAGGNAPPGLYGAGGGGGGGGGAIRTYPAPSIPGPQPFTVGGAGATSSFGSTVTVISATGGSSGGTPGTGTPVAGPNGVDGGANGSGSGGSINIGGSGGGAGTSINSGSGGNSIMGGGGRGQAGGTTRVGISGNVYGGGGGGAIATNSAGSRTGGAGAQGVVIVEEFY
jgi:hypothetical protein